MIAEIDVVWLFVPKDGSVPPQGRSVAIVQVCHRYADLLCEVMADVVATPVRVHEIR